MHTSSFKFVRLAIWSAASHGRYHSLVLCVCVCLCMCLFVCVCRGVPLSMSYYLLLLHVFFPLAIVLTLLDPSIALHQLFF